MGMLFVLSHLAALANIMTHMSGSGLTHHDGHCLECVFTAVGVILQWDGGVSHKTKYSPVYESVCCTECIL